MKKLINLRFRSCPLLKKFPSELRALQSLRYFTIEKTAISEIPNTISHLTNLYSLDFTESKLQEVPKALCNLSQLITLDLSGNQLSTLPNEFEKLKQLTIFRINDNQFTTLPDLLGKLPNLNVLSVSKNQLTQFPVLFQKLTLNSLHFGHNQFTKFPTFIFEQSQLDSLSFEYNFFEGVPKELTNLTKLERIHCIGNPFKTKPFFLLNLPMIKSLDSFKEVLSSKKSFLKAFQNIESESKNVLYDIIQNNQLHTIPFSYFFQALTIKFPPLQEIALAHILYDEEKILETSPIQQNSTITILGNTTTTKTEFKERISKIGIGYSTKINQKTTHVILAKGAKNYDGFDKEGLIFISENQFHQFLNIADTLYLNEDSTPKEDIENIRNLLIAKDYDSVALGVEMLQSLGVHKDILTELCLVVKNGFIPEKIRTKAKKLLMFNCSEKLKNQFKIYNKIFWSSSTKMNARFHASDVTFFARETELDIGKMALYIADHTNHYEGSFACYITDPQKNLEYIQACLKHQSDFRVSTDMFVDLNNIFKITCQFDLWVNRLEAYQLIKDKLYTLKLTSLNLYNLPIKELPPNFNQLETLKELRITRTQLSIFPKELENMSKLRTIHVDENIFSNQKEALNEDLFELKKIPYLITRK